MYFFFLLQPRMRWKCISRTKFKKDSLRAWDDKAVQELYESSGCAVRSATNTTASRRARTIETCFSLTEPPARLIPVGVSE
ncbi:hypothetical protein E2C01_029704 [Portunus trituberculatus]|uniref:Uncharacterized protein n=1 Tax=Portunus trituberculatus TaxID=210409 RepID=A0A5B7ETM3_PORTR|nr:hypothetical protein [Portunus trituberculatus]